MAFAPRHVIPGAFPPPHTTPSMPDAPSHTDDGLPAVATETIARKSIIGAAYHAYGRDGARDSERS